MTPIQDLVNRLQRELGVSVSCGSITVNVNDSTVQSVETRIHQRIGAKPLDKSAAARADLQR